MSDNQGSVAYLTRYDGLLCGACALDTSGLVGDGSRWLSGLTAVPVPDVLNDWPDDPSTCVCEECGGPFGAPELRP